jgi:hypothetical protein
VESVYAYATRHRAIEEYAEPDVFFAYFRLNTEFVTHLEGKILTDGGFFPPIESVMVNLESSSPSASSEDTTSATSEI